MSDLNIIRAWKDAEYRQSLSPAERALLPEHPAGLIELSDADLNAAGGRPRGGGCPTGDFFCDYPTHTSDCVRCCCTGDFPCDSDYYC
jgi:mersacidin/lichenicidin family type 2 lantibiotic